MKLKQPIIDLVNELKLIEDLDTNRYMYNGNPVPRTNDILSSMLHEEYLIQWANQVGLGHKKYEDVRDLAGSKGTRVHDLIEKFLNNEEVSFNGIPDNEIKAVRNGFNSFMSWYNSLTNNGNSIKCLASELKLVCPWYGGTADAIFEINGQIYLFDFKTSNQPSFRYFLQLAAYWYIINTYGYFKLNGVCILMLNKYKIEYDELILDFSILEHSIYFNDCLNTFFSLLYSYYNRVNIERGFNNLF